MKNYLKKIFWKLFPPNSVFDISLRNTYHFLFSSRLITNFKIILSKSSYHRWKKSEKRIQLPFDSNKSKDLGISFLTFMQYQEDLESSPIYKSLMHQKSDKWELIISIPQIKGSKEQYNQNHTSDHRITFI